MFYNIVICYNPIFGAKVRIFFHIAKFICKILQNYCFACIYQKKFSCNFEDTGTT